MLKVTKAESLGGHRLALVFSDGVAGEVDLASELHGTVFEPLLDERYFRRFVLTDHTVLWPNGADFAPEFLHELVVNAAVNS